METTASTLLKPVYSNLRSYQPASEMIPLTVFDRAAFDTFVPTVLAYSAPAPSNDALMDGLLRAIEAYPHLAGRLVVDDLGRRFLHVNNEGVLVQQAKISAALADVLLEGKVANVDELYPPVPEVNLGAALLQIKLNRYECGGLVVGIICHHHVADGHAMSTFFSAWASAVRAGKDFTVPSPFLDRAATAVPRGNPTPVFDHRSIEFKTRDSHSCVPAGTGTVRTDNNIRNITLCFSTEFISELKARINVPCSTLQCLLAHVWKRITAARDLEPECFTQVRVAVNCRWRAVPAAPTDFFGNMVLWAFPKLQAKELQDSSYAQVVQVIRDAVARVDGGYIQSFIDFGAVADGNGEELVSTTPAIGAMLCPDLEVDSWLGFQFHQTDFGTGPPCAFLPPYMPIEGLMIFVASRKEGSVDLFVSIAEGHVEAFQQICYRLD